MSTSPAGTYLLVLQSLLNNSPPSHAEETLQVIINDPCTLAQGNSIIIGKVFGMTTSALSPTAVIQTLSLWLDTASVTYGGDGLTLCGARDLTLIGTVPSFLSLSGTTLTLENTALADIGSHEIFILECLSSSDYANVCSKTSFFVTVTDCEVIS